MRSQDNADYPHLPNQFIFNESDMEKFRHSSTRKDFLKFINTLGQSCMSSSYQYQPESPLLGLSPGLAYLHGSLKAISTWIKEIPPDSNAKARFGNPSFRLWHERLVQRSPAIVSSILTDYTSKKMLKLQDCSHNGYKSATEESSPFPKEGRHLEMMQELCTYLHSSFGHPIRLDYGTGHESSFLVFLYCLFKIGCFDENSQCCFAAAAISIIMQYLEITRGLQYEYMLEPAGSHGVWGLDDYHCLPFYFGACQLVQQSFPPSCIHETKILQDYHQTFLYFSCILFIKKIKPGASFAESSAMLNDVSYLSSWSKIQAGLLRLFEGEVLDKLPVIQHFKFGKIFKATWKSSHKEKKDALEGELCASWR